MSLRIALAQTPNTSDLEAQRLVLRRLAERARQAGCDVLVFPECALSGYTAAFSKALGRDAVLAEARHLAALSGATHLVLPSAWWEGEQAVNGGVYIGPDGPAWLHKVGLTEPEAGFFAADRPAGKRSFVAGGVSVGLVLCREIDDPPYTYVDSATRIVLWPGYYGFEPDEAWEAGDAGRLGTVQAWGSAGTWVLQANAAFNGLGDTRKGPTGLSVVASGLRVAHRAPYREVGLLVVHVDGEPTGAVWWPQEPVSGSSIGTVNGGPGIASSNAV